MNDTTLNSWYSVKHPVLIEILVNPPFIIKCRFTCSYKRAHVRTLLSRCYLLETKEIKYPCTLIRILINWSQSFLITKKGLP